MMMLGTCNIGFVGSRCMFRLKNGLNELADVIKDQVSKIILLYCSIFICLLEL